MPAAARVRAHLSQHQHDRALAHDAALRLSSPSLAQTHRNRASLSLPRHTHSCKTAERRLARAVDRSRPGPAPGCACARAGDGARRPPGRTSRAQDMAQVGPRAAAPTGHLVNSTFFFCRKTENTEKKFVFRNECDAEGLGSLDRDAFAQGMARIDEELRRAQVLGRAGTGSDANGRTPRLAPSRPILR